MQEGAIYKHTLENCWETFLQKFVPWKYEREGGRKKRQRNRKRRKRRKKSGISVIVS